MKMINFVPGSMAVFLSMGAIALAAPTIDLNGSGAGVTHVGVYYGGSGYNGASFVSSPTITPDGSETFSAMEVRLLNRPDGPDEFLQQNFSFSGSLVATPYDTETGLFIVSGDGTASNYAHALTAIGYKNQNPDPQQMRRFIAVRVYDGIEWSDTVYGAVDLRVTPANPVLTTLFVDEFNSYDSSKWTVTSGVTPTTEVGYLRLIGGSIQTTQSFRAAPLLIEMTGVNLPGLLPSNNVTVAVVSTTPSPLRDTWWSISRMGDGGFFFGGGIRYGNQVLEGGYVDPSFPGLFGSRVTTYFDHKSFVMARGQQVVNSGTGWPFGGYQGNWRLELVATSGTELSVDRVRIGVVETTNPRIETFGSLDFDWRDMPTVGLKVRLDNDPQAPAGRGSVALSAARINVPPPGQLPGSIGSFWNIDIDSTADLLADLEFSVTSSELNSAGMLSDADVLLYRSTDNGNSWTSLVPTEVNRAAGYVRVTGLDGFSLWTIGPAVEPTSANNWHLYE